ncbi:hypothetical protein ACFVWN_01075 [Nocardiopsis flavescens]|uniref:hypothetical protein n=1 Tax=Nocardiopsis flavescens TaxID=758803 RepID=UPI00366295C6
MPVTTTNLIQGPADLFWGTFGVTEPAKADIVGNYFEDLPVADLWHDCGGTQGGLTLELNQEYGELEVDQIVDVPESRLTKRVYKVNTNLAEPTLDNFKIVANGGTITEGAGYRDYEPDMDNSAVSPRYGAILVQGIAPAGMRRWVIVRKVLNEATVGSEQLKDGQAVFPTEFKSHYITRAIRPFTKIDEIDSSGS